MVSAGDILRRTRAFLERGFRAVRRRIDNFVERRIFGAILERRMGIATSGVIEADELGYSEAETLPYEPTDWRAVKRAFPRGSVSSDDVFIDLGSGMGRTVLIASELPFKRAIGVEFSPRLHAAALSNLEKARIKRREAVEFVRADVREYEVPDDVTVVFLFNPFNGEVFDSAMARVFASYDRAPRRIRIVYRLPREHEQLLATGRVKVLSEVAENWTHGLPRGVGTITYEVLPAGDRS